MVKFIIMFFGLNVLKINKLHAIRTELMQKLCLIMRELVSECLGVDQSLN